MLSNKTNISPLRLRLGIILIIIWWVPLWLLAPYIASMIDSGDSEHLVAVITTAIVVAQTIIGFLGILFAGQEVKSIVKHSSKKQALKSVWHILLHGYVAEPEL